MRYQSKIQFCFNQSQNKGITLNAPVSGQVEPIEVMPGANHLINEMGEGVAIKMEGQMVYSPFNAIVLDWQPGFGKVVLQAANKLRFIIQLDFKCMAINGLGIKSFVRVGQKIASGSPLFQVDLYKLRLHLTTVKLYFLLINHNQIKSIEVIHKYVTGNQDKLFNLVPFAKTQPNVNNKEK